MCQEERQRQRLIGVGVALATASFNAVGESLRSSTWVAPREERSSALCKEAVGNDRRKSGEPSKLDGYELRQLLPRSLLI